MSIARDWDIEHLHFGTGLLREGQGRDGGRRWEGLVESPYGYVRVISDEDDGYTYLMFIYAGRYYTRTTKRFYEKRYLVELTKKFVNDVIQGRTS